MIDTIKDLKWPLVIFAAILALFIWVIVMYSQEMAKWEKWCIDQGGYVDRVTRTYYCLTSDGRIIDIVG